MSNLLSMLSDTEFEQFYETHSAPSKDFSWLLVAIDSCGEGWILDASPGFYDCDLLINGSGCDDNGVYIPANLQVGVYRVVNTRISGGELIQSPNGDDYSSIEISGDWRRLWPSSGSASEV